MKRSSLVHGCLLGELDRAAAVVRLAGRARPVLSVTVAVDRRGGASRRALLLLEAVAPREGAIGRGGPPAGGLVGGLCRIVLIDN